VTAARVPEGPSPAAAQTCLADDVVERTTALVNVADRDGRLVLANPALQRFTGLAEAELLGRPFWEVFVVPEDVARARTAFGLAISGGLPFPDEGDWLAVDGRRRRIAMQNSVLVDEQGRPCGVACVGIDVTEDRRTTALLGEQATTDPLTGVRNRSALFTGLQRHLDPHTGSPCGLLFCDLDDFKQVNDRHGHAVGDKLLVEVAARLLEVTGPDDVVARFGGDEFVVLRPGADEAALADLVQRVETRLRDPLGLPCGRLWAGASIGSAIGRPGDDADDLVVRADHRMYAVKTRRRSRRG
jgi:cyclic di-GMP phosphodiesterase Gmr